MNCWMANWWVFRDQNWISNAAKIKFSYLNNYRNRLDYRRLAALWFNSLIDAQSSLKFWFFVRLLSLRMSASLPVCTFRSLLLWHSDRLIVNPSVCSTALLSDWLFACLFAYLSIYLSSNRTACLSICLPMFISVIHVCPHIFLSACIL